MFQAIRIVGLVALLSTLSTALAEEKISPMTVPGAKTVTAAEAKGLFDQGGLFVDVRNDKDWEAGRIPDALHLDLHKGFDEAALTKAAKKEEPVVFYCNGEKCLRSSEASAKAVGWGFSKVYYFRDGFPGWKAAGYPVE